ncbi:Mhp366/Mhp367 family surface (lipo)protein [Mesomycoplasma flocculare]|uniref:Mhp366/Mhp367 family surface (lipo)protein n=1 Tax=Mesomycoplasma flocculare TaxID=2128 RepID=UPI0034DD0D59
MKNEETAKNENKLGLNENPKTNQTKKNDQKTELNSQNKEDKKTTKNDFPLETASNSAKKSSLDFTKANQNSLKINTDSLSQVSQTDFKKFSPSQTDKNSLNPIPPTYNKYQLENWGNIIKKENENTFLGQESENLNIYVLKNIAPNLVSDIKARENPYTYFNLSWGGGSSFYKLPWFGFKSDLLENVKYANIFTRNIRFGAGTAVFLNANSEKAAFLTNKHVIGDSHITFWKLMNKKDQNDQINPRYIKFMRYYDDSKIKELDNRILFKLWEIKWYDDKHFPYNPAWGKIDELDKYMENLYDNYFEENKDFKNNNLDIAVFYFNYAKFIKNIEDLIKHFKDKGQEFLNSFELPTGETLDNFISSFNEFKKYWEKISKFDKLKISDKIWELDNFDYTTKIGLFWAQNFISKNIFKGVYFTPDPQDPKNPQNSAVITPKFFAANGLGASGSGIFNADGSLAFLNKAILGVSSIGPYFYDQFGLTSHMSSGVTLRTKDYNLVDEIYKTYLK